MREFGTAERLRPGGRGRFLDPLLAASVELDGEESTFVASGDGHLLNHLDRLLAPLFSSPTLIVDVIRRAEAVGFTLEH